MCNPNKKDRVIPVFFIYNQLILNTMKPQLDTDTVLTIIQMIDRRIDFYAKYYPINNDKDYQIAIGKEMALSELQNYLQEYIEGLVTQAENQLGGGE